MFDQDVDVYSRTGGHKVLTGTTNTGMADCFQSFGYFGFVKFLLIGYIMGRWYARGLHGDLLGQLTYVTMMGAALHTVSHGTHWLVNAWIHMAIFSYPFLYWARKPLVTNQPPTTAEDTQPLQSVAGGQQR